MANYIYLPVNSAEMREFADNVKDQLKVPATNILANKVSSGVGKAMYRWIDKCVKNVGANDSLYIILHGSGVADSKKVGAERNIGNNKQTKVHVRGVPEWTGGKYKTYEPTHLASTLKKEGLTTLVTDIHLLTCGSGLEGKMKSWAERLKDALKNHCKNLTVTGYKGNISVFEKKVTIQVESEWHSMKDEAVSF